MNTLQVIREGRVEGNGGLSPSMLLNDGSFLINSNSKDNSIVLKISTEEVKTLDSDFKITKGYATC